MAFLRNGDLPLAYTKLQQGNDVAVHELGAYRATDKLRKLFPTHRQILFNLHHADLVAPTLGLNRQNVVGALAINAHIDFVRFNLPNRLDGRSQMVLKRITNNSGKYVDESIVTQFCEQRLLIA